MAKKERCPSCGKRNRAGERRCVVCAALLHPEAAEVPRGLSVPPGGGTQVRSGMQEHDAGAQATDPQPPQPPPNRPAPTEQNFVDQVQPQGPFPIPPSPPSESTEAFDPDGLQLDRPLRPSPLPPPPPLADHERFDPDGLVIDPRDGTTDSS